MSQLAQRLESLLAPVVSGQGLYLEGVAVKGGGRHRVVVVTVDLPDGPGGVGSDALAVVSRAVSAELDATDLIRSAYLLEVTTPGVSRPLSEPRHYRRAVGRLVRLRRTDGAQVTGRLVAADADGVTVREGDADGARRTMGYGDLAGGSIEVELRGLEDGPEGAEREGEG